MVGRPFQRRLTDHNLNIKHRQTILTGNPKHTDQITTGQRVIRHTSRPLCFLFFCHRTFLKTILASRRSGTFGFARHTSQRFAKPKEPLFSQRTENEFEKNRMDTKQYFI